MENSQPSTGTDRYKKWRRKQEECNPNFKLQEKERVKAWRNKNAEMLTSKEKQERRKYETERKRVQRARNALETFDGIKKDICEFSPYKCKQTYCKALRKCLQSLPTCPYKRRAVVMGVARLIGLNVEEELTKNTAQETHDDEAQTAVKDFYFRSDILNGPENLRYNGHLDRS